VSFEVPSSARRLEVFGSRGGRRSDTTSLVGLLFCPGTINSKFKGTFGSLLYTHCSEPSTTFCWVDPWGSKGVEDVGVGKG
jgi:hypothetical protein